MRASRSLPLTTEEEATSYRRSGIWPDETLYQRFRRIAGERRGKVAIIEAGRRFTYGELLDQVDRLARGLSNAGIAAGDVVAVQVPNCMEHPLAHFALNRIGALAMPIHESWREAELPHLLELGGAVAAIVPSNHRGVDYPALYAGLRKRLPKLTQVFAIGAPNAHAERFDTLLSDTGEARDAADPDAPGDLMLSSGTTSLPKISVYSSNDLIALLSPFWKRIRITPDDVAAALAPAGTGAIGYVYPILSPLLNGATTVILEHWGEPEEAVELIVRNHCTYGTAVPAQLTQMLPSIKARPKGAYAAFRCFTNAGAPLPPDVGRQIEEHMECRIFSIYGATDGGVATCTDLDDTQEQRLTTVGRAQDGCEIRLVDVFDKPVAPGQSGEIQWRTAGKSFGYLNDPEATAAVFTSDRFYRTGDLGAIDEHGYVRITGRAKDMIIRGGRNISPHLIEETASKHPDISEVAVAAFPDAVLGERACVFAVLSPGARMTLPELLAFLKQHQMPTWQMPERLEVMQDLPRSAGGKVMKNKLREYVAAKVMAEAGQSASHASA